MKHIVVFLSMLFITLSLCKAQKPEKIYSIAKVDKTHQYYVNQAELWWKEIEKNEANEDAWLNYYRANRYSCMTYKNINRFDGKKNEGFETESPYLKKLDDILNLVEQKIPNTFTYYRLKKNGFPGDESMFKYLEKAYNMRPEDAELYDAIVTYYEMKGDLEKRKEFNEKLYKSNEISSGFLNYGYNVLVSLKSNSIILTFGDNDTYPLWLLQDVFNIRPDIIVLNIPLAGDLEYQKLLFKRIGIPLNEKVSPEGSTTESENDMVEFILKNNDNSKHPLYVGLPAWREMKNHENNLYLIGLALEYSTSNLDNIAQLRNNYERNFSLDYVNNRFEYDRSASIVDRMNINYLPGIFKLYEHYTQSGDLNGAHKMKYLGLRIAQKAGNEWLDKAQAVLK